MNNWKQKLTMRLPAILLLVATALFWGFYDRYEAAGPVLLKSPSIADATHVRGNSSETNGHFVLTVPASGKTSQVIFRMPKSGGYERIRVRGRIKVHDVVKGKYPWSRARLLLLQRDKNKKGISSPHEVVTEQGSKDWTFHEEVFELEPETAYTDLTLQQIGQSGTAEFDQLMAEPVQFRTSFIGWRIIFSSLWIFMAVLYFRRCRLHRRKLKWLILLNILAILAGTLMPGVWIQDSSEKLKQTIAKSLEKPQPPKPSTQPLEKPIRKTDQQTKRIDQLNEAVGGAHSAGHFLLFASLCFLVYCSAALEQQHPTYFLKVGVDILLFATITESLQHLTIDRSAGISDLKIDLYGMAAALLLFLIVLPLIRRFCVKPG